MELKIPVRDNRIEGLPSQGNPIWVRFLIRQKCQRGAGRLRHVEINKKLVDGNGYALQANTRYVSHGYPDE